MAKKLEFQNVKRLRDGDFKTVVLPNTKKGFSKTKIVRYGNDVLTKPQFKKKYPEVASKYSGMKKKKGTVKRRTNRPKSALGKTVKSLFSFK